jgi:hypothetical protein
MAEASAAATHNRNSAVCSGARSMIVTTKRGNPKGLRTRKTWPALMKARRVHACFKQGCCQGGGVQSAEHGGVGYVGGEQVMIDLGSMNKAVLLLARAPSATSRLAHDAIQQSRATASSAVRKRRNVTINDAIRSKTPSRPTLLQVRADKTSAVLFDVTTLSTEYFLTHQGTTDEPPRSTQTSISAVNVMNYSIVSAIA